MEVVRRAKWRLLPITVEHCVTECQQQRMRDGEWATSEHQVWLMNQTKRGKEKERERAGETMPQTTATTCSKSILDQVTLHSSLLNECLIDSLTDWLTVASRSKWLVRTVCTIRCWWQRWWWWWWWRWRVGGGEGGADLEERVTRLVTHSDSVEDNLSVWLWCTLIYIRHRTSALSNISIEITRHCFCRWW